MSFRVPWQIRDQAEEVARREGRRLSDVARQALEGYLARAPEGELKAHPAPA